MKNKQIVGIDVSKNVLDVYIFYLKYHFTVSNNPSGFARLIEVCTEKLKEDMPNVFFCFEDTGRYSKLLSVFLEDAHFIFSALNALDIKRSMGLTRGKSDKKYARMIALYAWRKRMTKSCTGLKQAIISSRSRVTGSYILCNSPGLCCSSR
jgi:transposase